MCPEIQARPVVSLPSHLAQLEAEAITILREAAASFAKPVLLYSVGKDSSVLLHLARKAFHPAKPPFPLLHIDTTWKFRDMIAFRDATAERLGLELIVHINEDGLARAIDPTKSGSALYTQVMKTEALRQALDRHGFDAAIGGARRDEEASRSKEPVFSVRAPGHLGDPRRQRPKLWHIYNSRLAASQHQNFRASRTLDRHGRAFIDGAQETRGLFLMARAFAVDKSDSGLLRIVACGSVDDGKSTLVGRLLAETGTLPVDYWEALTRLSRRYGSAGDDLDYALLLDGLEGEREQKITIDVAYRYFATPQRNFIVADTAARVRWPV